MKKSLLTKAEIAKIIAEKFEISERKALEIENTIFQAILSNLKEEGSKITIRGFGTFERKLRKARNGVNMKTGEKIRIKPRSEIKFKSSKETKEIIEE